jgi:hypothetical protein
MATDALPGRQVAAHQFTLMKNDPNSLIVECDDSERIVAAINALMPRLPVQTRRQLTSVKLGILETEGKTGLHSRLNGRTVGDIIASETPRGLGDPIETGELDGLKYSLYESNDES